MAIVFFGILGICSRYGLDVLLAEKNQNWPLSTFTINILGSLIAGTVYGFAERFSIHPAIQLGLLVGFCGGFTTFSAYALQAFLMLDKGKLTPALFYISMSPILGLLAACLPILMIRKFIT